MARKNRANSAAIVDEEELDDWDDEEESNDRVSGSSYSSPVMMRMSSRRLTLQMLDTEIPLIRDGENAAKKLEESNSRLGEKKRRELLLQMRKGEEAKERLFASALPLIKTVAAREWHRRQQWGSQVSLEDLTQETIIGFLKGLAGFKLDQTGTSPTNYLGQWMLVETRRAAEVMDHDLQVGHDAGERFRRVRALRTRLQAEYGREPTDEEISAASRNPDYITRPGMVGKAPVNGEERAAGKGVTVNQVEEERTLRSRVGRMARFATSDDNDESSSGPGLIDPARENVFVAETANSLYYDPADQVIESDASLVVSDVLNKAMERLDLPEIQREIVSRKYGLPPYEEESSAREIARIMRIQRDKVSKILSAFQQEMTRPGGSLHAVIRYMDSDDLKAVGLTWAVDALGEWPAGPVPYTASILLDPIVMDKPPAPAEKTKASGVMAWFHCDYHDRTFSGMYQDRKSVPRTRLCPSCQKPSDRVKMVDS